MTRKTEIKPLATSKITQELRAHSKLAMARRHLERLRFKLPRLINASVFNELEQITLVVEDDFIQQHCSTHLSRLAYSIALVKKTLSQNVLVMEKKCDVRFLPSFLQFPFGTKPVLGILTHAFLRDRYEAFDEKHILLKIRKLIPEAQIVKDSLYALQSSKNKFKTLYFEIDKKNGLPFSSEEITSLRRLLKQEIQFCIEQLTPYLFMTRNEEEILKNILTLSREIHLISNPPEVMIVLDRQTPQEVVFTVILVRIFKKQPSISDLFALIQGNFSYFPERCQIVRYLKKKHPIEANVFRIHLPKDPSFLRADLSVNFYLARQKVFDLLTQTVGPFRDFNGGIILKQRENFISFVEASPDFNPDLLESFFYSLSPIESQATLSVASLKRLFELFLEARLFEMERDSSYFLGFGQQGDQILCMIRISDESFKQTMNELFASAELSSLQIVASTLYLQNSYFLGYLITMTLPDFQDRLKQAIIEALTAWQEKMKNRKILTLGLEYPAVSLDPRIGGDQISSLLLRMLSEGLMRENREGEIEYGIAKTVEISLDLKTYLFKLRLTQWSDRSCVTAFDFEYAWKKVLSPSFKTPFAYLFYPIKNAELAKRGQINSDAIGVKALDETTLRVELRSPTPYFLELTALTIYSPVHHLIDSLHPNWPFEEGSSYICNGAFQLTKNKPAEGYELIKNPLYWDAENIQLDRIIFFKMNCYQAFEMFKKNNHQWIGSPLMVWNSSFTPGKDEEKVDFLNKNMRWVVFNCRKSPFNHPKMRQAFSLAIDRAQLATFFHSQPAVSPLPAHHSLIKQPPSSFFNLQKAKDLFHESLEEMGLSKKDFGPLTFIYLPGDLRTDLVHQVTQFWEAAFSIRCITQPLKWDALFKKVIEGDYQVGLTTWDPWVNDPMYTLNAFREAKEPINPSKWENDNYQKILSLAEKEINFQKREEYYLQAENLLLEEMPIAPLLSTSFQALKKKRLKIKCASNLINFKWAYFE